jgi:hypothetical protein
MIQKSAATVSGSGKSGLLDLDHTSSLIKLVLINADPIVVGAQRIETQT